MSPKGQILRKSRRSENVLRNWVESSTPRSLWSFSERPETTMIELKQENWFYCGTCDTIAYRLECCGNTSCNGGGCTKCTELWDEVWRVINAGKAPAKDSVPHIPNDMDYFIAEALKEKPFDPVTGLELKED